MGGSKGGRGRKERRMRGREGGRAGGREGGGRASWEYSCLDLPVKYKRS